MGTEGGGGAQALSVARDTDALLMILRSFQDPTVLHVLDTVDPVRDYARMSEELLLADLAVVENRIESIRKDIRRCPAVEREQLQAELELLERCQEDEPDRAAFMEDAGLSGLAADRVVRGCYEALGLRTFFTYVHDEVGVWTVQAGDDAVTAAGKIHSDMARAFIRAEVVAFDELKACGSIKEAKAQGKVRLEGKDYEVKDGDVITFRFGGS